MPKQLFYTVAQDAEGHLITATDVEKGHAYSCPLCGTSLVLRKSGNTDKNSKRAHFGHKTLTPNCTPETALHHSFKMLLAQKIKGYLLNKQPLFFDWRCEDCKEDHSGNLTKKTYSVDVEYTGLEGCRPDIALFDVGGKIFAVIEVVVSHKPETKTLEYYKANQIILIRIDLKSDEDIYKIDEIISRPTHVDFCVNPICGDCGSHMQTKVLEYYMSKCADCGHPNFITYVRKYSNDDYGGIFEFTKEEKAWAVGLGVNIKWRISKKQNFYLANVCTACDNILQEQNMGRFWCSTFPPASEEDLDNHELYLERLEVKTHKRNKIGHYCGECEYTKGKQ